MVVGSYTRLSGVECFYLQRRLHKPPLVGLGVLARRITITAPDRLARDTVALHPQPDVLRRVLAKLRFECTCVHV